MVHKDNDLLNVIVSFISGVIEYIKKLFEKRSGERKIYTHVTQATDKGGVISQDFFSTSKKWTKYMSLSQFFNIN